MKPWPNQARKALPYVLASMALPVLLLLAGIARPALANLFDPSCSITINQHVQGSPRAESLTLYVTNEAASTVTITRMDIVWPLLPTHLTEIRIPSGGTRVYNQDTLSPALADITDTPLSAGTTTTIELRFNLSTALMTGNNVTITFHTDQGTCGGAFTVGTNAPWAKDDNADTNVNIPVTIDVTANDVDLNGDLDPSSVRVTAGPSRGGTSVNPSTGEVTYTPNSGYIGTDAFTYEICDLGGRCDTAQVNIEVFKGCSITLIDYFPRIPCVDCIRFSLRNNDSDPVTIDGLTPFVWSPAGRVLQKIDFPSWDPSKVWDADVTSPATITFTSSEPISAGATVSMDVDWQNTGAPPAGPFTITFHTNQGTCQVTTAPTAPIAADDSVTTDEDTAVTINVVANDTDANSDLNPASVSIASVPGNGSATPNGDGTVTYAPNLNFNGTDSFQYEVCDLTSLCDTAVVTVTVNAVEDPPDANDDATSTNEDNAVTVNVAANDTDPENNLDVSSASVSTPPGNGGAVSNGDGTITYTPNLNFNGTDSFTYQICDTTSLCSTASVTVTVAAVNDPPDAVNDSATTDEDTPVLVAVSTNDTDVDGNLDATSVNVTGAPTNGSATPDGLGSITYSPALNYNGVDTFTYEICDTDGACDTATVSITINPVNDPPIAVNDASTTPEDTLRAIDVLANDSDVDGDPLTITNVGSTTSLDTSAALNNNGTPGDPSDDFIDYTPTNNFNGLDSFTYTISDGNGGTATATVTVDVGPVNDPPVAQDDSITTSEDTAITANVVSNDSDPDGNLNPGSVTITQAPAHGSAVSNGDGTVTYTPSANYNGLDSFRYQVCDTDNACDTAQVSVTVTPVNDPPVANNDTASTPEDNAVIINVAANDTDVDGNLDPTSVSVTAPPANGTATPNGNGTVTYTPNANFNGTNTFQYQICDTNSACATATVTVNVTPVNDYPVANDDTASTNEDTPVTINVTGNDTDIDGNLNPASARTITAPLHGTTTDNGDGTITYSPALNYNGSDSFRYEVCDSQGACDAADVSITVNPVNDPPNAVNDTAVTNEEVAIIINVAANDSDVDGNLNPASATPSSTPANGTATGNGDGTITYTPNLNFNGVNSFSYTICDTDGACSTALVTVTVNQVNDPPTANPDSAATTEDVATTINVIANDTDVDGNLDPASVTVINGPFNGTATPNGDGTVTYTPAADFSGNDTFTYRVCDAFGVCDTATVSITINGVDDAPSAVNDAASTSEDTGFVIDVLINDSDADGNLDPASVSITTAPASGTATPNPDGTITYIPNSNFTGVDSFVYRVCDTTSLCSTATVTVTVTAVNDPPVAVADSATTNEDTAVTINVAANDSDPEGNLNINSAAVTGTPVNGTAVSNGNGTITFTPRSNFNGTGSFTYRICDTQNACSTATVTITVLAVNDPPVANNDSASTLVSTAVTINVLANDSDVDGNLVPNSLTIITAPAHGSAVRNTANQIIYTPNGGYVGSDSLVYRVCDASLACDTATVSITISAQAANTPVPTNTPQPTATTAPTQTPLPTRTPPAAPTGTPLPEDEPTAIPEGAPEPVAPQQGSGQIEVRKRADRGEAGPGGLVIFYTTVRNSGTQPISGVAVLENLVGPAFVERVGIPHGSLAITAAGAEWQIDTLGPGETAVIQVEVRINDEAVDGAQLISCATPSGDQGTGPTVCEDVTVRLGAPQEPSKVQPVRPVGIAPAPEEGEQGAPVNGPNGLQPLQGTRRRGNVCIGFGDVTLTCFPAIRWTGFLVGLVILVVGLWLILTRRREDDEKPARETISSY